MTTRRFRSCYIVDVAINAKTITLKDSSQYQYYIDMSNETLVDEFKQWFKDTFTKGVSQSLTVLQYEIVDVSECETEMHVVKFLNKNYSI